MSASKDHKDHIAALAAECLETFEKISESAKSELAKESCTGSVHPSLFANAGNAESTQAAASNMNRIRRGKLEICRMLEREPAIARVVVKAENNTTKIYYICRSTNISVNDTKIELASYRSNVGRLAALDVGEEDSLPLHGKVTSIKVLENAKLRPDLVDQKWDSVNSIIEGIDYGPQTIKSMLEVTRDHSMIEKNMLDKLLDEERARESIHEGIRHSIITSMDLRDQPILDKYQDAIFRLPLNSRLLILGAPGTGKTTTLIRRLGQKLDTKFLNEEERRMVGAQTFDDEDAGTSSWIMFTPTNLLQLYVKEAFNREGIPASDRHISTWSDYRENLARNEFRILRSPTQRNGLIMKNTVPTLDIEIRHKQIDWFSDFEEYNKSIFWEEMNFSARNLSENKEHNIKIIGEKILMILNTSESEFLSNILSLMKISSEIRNLIRNIKTINDRKIRSALNLQINRDRQFLDKIISFIEKSRKLNDEMEDQDIDDEEDPNTHQVGRTAALDSYMRAIRAKARARAQKRNIDKANLTGRLIDWIGTRSPTEQELQEMGESLIVQSSLRRFANPVRRYIDGMTARYRRFRRTRQKEGQWYRTDGFGPTDIHPMEVDVLLLAMIRYTNELIVRAHRSLDIDSSSNNTLNRLQDLYRTQVLVDEVTDFSPIQLACMATLARPGPRSFFACGDFNQRMTNWGARSVEEIRWAVSDILIKEISAAYRQSRKLHEFAREIINLSDADSSNADPPSYLENDGVSPILATNLSEISEITSWLAHRIVEIEGFVRVLPSIAVLVNDEENVHLIATALKDSLADENIRVIPCADGMVRGQDSAVRVFNVKHIKGLEFEAVFYVGIDQLAEREPDLFDKYLYVGATRAATYLGITCERKLPARMAGLEKLFGDSWQ